MDLELHRQRRNLIGIALALIVFDVAGGDVKEVTFLNGGVSLANPELLIALSYLALAYALWRYWLYVRPEHKKLTDLVRNKFESLPEYRALVDPKIDAFNKKSGVEESESHKDFASDTPEKEVQIDTEIVGNIFSRKLVLSVDNPRGDFHPDREILPIPNFAYERMRASAWVRIVFGEKSFSDLFVPYLLAFFAVLGLLYRVLSA